MSATGAIKMKNRPGTAAHIILKMGGPTALAKLLREVFPDNPEAHHDYDYLRRLAYSGKDLPPQMLKNILAAARIAGILITPEDVFPPLHR